MANFRLSSGVMCGVPAARRLLIGVPVLSAVMALCAWVAWANNGFPSDLAPRHWFDQGIPTLLGLVFCGGLTLALGLVMLWIFGIVAGVFGEGVIAAWRHLRRGDASHATPCGTCTDESTDAHFGLPGGRTYGEAPADPQVSKKTR